MGTDEHLLDGVALREDKLHLSRGNDPIHFPMAWPGSSITRRLQDLGKNRRVPDSIEKDPFVAEDPANCLSDIFPLGEWFIPSARSALATCPGLASD